MKEKECTRCGDKKPHTIENFRVAYRKNGKEYLRSMCRSCDNKDKNERRNRRRLRGEYSNSERSCSKRYHQSISYKRKNLIDVPRWILEDSRKTDKKRGFENDLDIEFITSAIEHGCSYCGKTSGRMTLDRIDNSKGHTKVNVVAACKSCNYIRRDMPYEAWLTITPSVREAREQGLFGEWEPKL